MPLVREPICQAAIPISNGGKRDIINQVEIRYDKLRGLARIQRVYQDAIFILNKTASYFAGTRQFVVVWIEFFMQNQETVDLCA